MGKTCTNRYGTALSNSLSIIEKVKSGLHDAIDARSMYEVVRRRQYLERMSGYMSLLMDACGRELRSYCGSVYYFNGRYWEPLGDVLFESAVCGVLDEFKADKGDIVRGSSKIIRSARQGAMLSPLQPSKAVVGFSNGVVDFTDIDRPVMHGFSERLDVTSVLPYAYDPGADCPTWKGFLSDVLRPGQVDTLQKFMGLGCVPRSNMSRKVEKTLWLVGSGANGKSVIHDVMVYVYGDGNFSDASLYNLIKPGDEGLRCIASIAGKLFNYCTEVDSGDISRYEGNFKSLVSGERQQVRRIGGNVEMIDEIPYLVFNMNQQPTNRGMGRAFMRRVQIIDFRSVVSDKDQRLDLVDVLCREASGIRNWLIEGYMRLRACDFKFETAAESREYMMQNEQGPMVFMGDMGYRDSRLAGHPEEEPQWLRAGDLYDEYCRWCRNKEGVDPDNLQKFGRDLTRLRYQRKRTSTGNVYAVYSSKVIRYALDI